MSEGGGGGGEGVNPRDWCLSQHRASAPPCFQSGVCTGHRVQSGGEGLRDYFRKYTRAGGSGETEDGRYTALMWGDRDSLGSVCF